MKRVSKLEGEDLDYWVAQAAGMTEASRSFRLDGYSPSTNWAQGGPIIDSEKISVLRSDVSDNSGWEAHVGGWMSHDFVHGDPIECGTTPLIAAMRAYVASKFGEEVPDE